MPDPPPVGLLTRYLLENPWPLVTLGAVIATILIWTGLRDGLSGRTRAGLAVALLAAGLFGLETLVRTSGEHARPVVRDLVDAAATNDLVALDGLLAATARLTVGSPRNPGFGKDVILDQAARLRDEFRVESCRITSLKPYSESSTKATVHLACWTEFTEGLYSTPSQWVLEVEQQEDGSWRVTQLTCITIAGRPAAAEWWR